MGAPVIDIVGCGSSYAIVHGGKTLGHTTSYAKACGLARTWESRLQQHQRACMCCGKQFMAEGHGNRICTPCKIANA